MTEVERLRMWLLNDEGLYQQVQAAAQYADPATGVAALQDSIVHALRFDKLTAFQLEFMPNVDHWRTVDMLQELLEDERA